MDLVEEKPLHIGPGNLELLQCCCLVQDEVPNGVPEEVLHGRQSRGNVLLLHDCPFQVSNLVYLLDRSCYPAQAVLRLGRGGSVRYHTFLEIEQIRDSCCCSLFVVCRLLA